VTFQNLRNTYRPGTWAKTGTSDHHRDCLILGGDSRFTVLIWLGRLKGSDPVLPASSGASLCGQVLEAVLNK
jgi:membrane carboxypeptidase/penicillin-binding protein PbpC